MNEWKWKEIGDGNRSVSSPSPRPQDADVFFCWLFLFLFAVRCAGAASNDYFVGVCVSVCAELFMEIYKKFSFCVFNEERLNSSQREKEEHQKIEFEFLSLEQNGMRNGMCEWDDSELRRSKGGWHPYSSNEKCFPFYEALITHGMERHWMESLKFIVGNWKKSGEKMKKRNFLRNLICSVRESLRILFFVDCRCSMHYRNCTHTDVVVVYSVVYVVTTEYYSVNSQLWIT